MYYVFIGEFQQWQSCCGSHTSANSTCTVYYILISFHRGRGWMLIVHVWPCTIRVRYEGTHNSIIVHPCPSCMDRLDKVQSRKLDYSTRYSIISNCAMNCIALKFSFSRDTFRAHFALTIDDWRWYSYHIALHTCILSPISVPCSIALASSYWI